MQNSASTAAPMTALLHRRPWLTLLTLGGLWLVLCRVLALHWSVNPQYSFGWLVPALAAYLAHRRWLTRPAPAAPSAAALWVIVACALAFLPAWVVAQPFPDWRLVDWVLALEVAALLVAACAAAGGGKWALHFAFPACFILTAVPWPGGIEEPAIQGLMRASAAVVVELLNLTGIPALRHGNLIEIAAGTLGVDEACSGVRSLQATLMAAFFLGEMYRFPWCRRVVLIGAGLVVALSTNTVRTLLLARCAARDGLDALAAWHDPAGFTLVTICFALVWIAALWLGRGLREPLATRVGAPMRVLPRAFERALAVWFALVFAGTEAWFHKGSEPAGREWSLVQPPGAQQVKIEPDAAAMLLADHSAGWTWRDGGHEWLAYYFEWNAGAGRARVLARMHRPDICLPASGARQTAERGVIAVPVGPLNLGFRAYTFEIGGRPVHVYFCLWENGARGRGAVDFNETLRHASLRAVLDRERGLGQQVAELAVFGCASAEEADAAFRTQIASLLQTEAAGYTVPK